MSTSQHPNLHRIRTLNFGGLAGALGRDSFLALLFALTVNALGSGTVNVTTVADTVDGLTTSIGALIASPGVDGKISLREAIQAANNTPSSSGNFNLINIPPGIYNLTRGELALGNPVNRATYLLGNAAATTTIRQADGTNRVLNLDPNVTGGQTNIIQNVTITGGRDSVDSLGGAGILAGVSSSLTAKDSLTLNGCIITDNRSGSPGSTVRPGGGVQMGGGFLTINNCDISSNSAGGSGGGGIWFNTLTPSKGSLTIINSTLIGNTLSPATGVAGGAGVAIYGSSDSVHTISGSTLSANLIQGVSSGSGVGGGVYINGGSLTISSSTLVGNGVFGTGARGGGINVESGVLTAAYCRIVGNTSASAGGGLYNSGLNGATTTAINNWWGCNGGPGSLGCDLVSGSGPAPNTSPWIVLKASVNPTTINSGLSTTLTAGFLQNSAGQAINGAQIPVLAGLPAVWGGMVHGGLAGQQVTTQTGGTAAATLINDGTCNNSSATVTIDGTTVTGLVTVVCVAPTLVCPSEIRTNSGNGQCGQTVSFAVSTSGSPSPIVEYRMGTAAITSPYVFPIGTNVVVSTASNRVGTNSCSFQVVVADSQPPLAGPDNVGALSGNLTGIPLTRLLANDISTRGGALRILGVDNFSTHGGKVTLGSNTISYAPPSGFVGPDQFTYALNDGCATIRGTVTVAVISSESPPYNVVSMTVSNGVRKIRFSGIPFQSYFVQWTYSLDGKLTDFPGGPFAADSGGLLSYIDQTVPIPPTRFYRLRTAP